MDEEMLNDRAFAFAGRRDIIRAKVVAILNRCDPGKVSKVDMLLNKFEGRERDMFMMIRETYGMQDELEDEVEDNEGDESDEGDEGDEGDVADEGENLMREEEGSGEETDAGGEIEDEVEDAEEHEEEEDFEEEARQLELELKRQKEKEAREEAEAAKRREEQERRRRQTQQKEQEAEERRRKLGEEEEDDEEEEAERADNIKEGQTKRVRQLKRGGTSDIVTCLWHECRHYARDGGFVCVKHAKETPNKDGLIVRVLGHEHARVKAAVVTVWVVQVLLLPCHAVKQTLTAPVMGLCKKRFRELRATHIAVTKHHRKRKWIQDLKELPNFPAKHAQNSLWGQGNKSPEFLDQRAGELQAYYDALVMTPKLAIVPCFWSMFGLEFFDGVTLRAK